MPTKKPGSDCPRSAPVMTPKSVRGVLPRRRSHADERRERERDQDRRDLDLQRLPAPGRQHLADRLVVHDAGAEIAAAAMFHSQVP